MLLLDFCHLPGAIGTRIAQVNAGADVLKHYFRVVGGVMAY